MVQLWHKILFNRFIPYILGSFQCSRWEKIQFCSTPYSCACVYTFKFMFRLPNRLHDLTHLSKLQSTSHHTGYGDWTFFRIPHRNWNLNTFELMFLLLNRLCDLKHLFNATVYLTSHWPWRLYVFCILHGHSTLTFSSIFCFTTERTNTNALLAQTWRDTCQLLLLVIYVPKR